MAYMDGDISPRRIEAFAIDTSFVIMICIAMINLASLVPDALPLQLILVFIVIIGGYFVPYKIWRGQTFGKKSRGIQLVNMDETQCSAVKIVFREIFKVGLSISTVGVYCVIAGIVMLFRKDERTIHDFIFRTRVIEKKLFNKYDKN